MSLPLTRVLANQLGVSRNTALLAYDRLAAEGYVEARGTAGVFVTAIAPDDLLLSRTVSLHWPTGPSPMKLSA